MVGISQHHDEQMDAIPATQLLNFLGEVYGEADLEYLDPPQRILGGAEAEIFGFNVSTRTKELSGSLVLRLFSEGRAVLQARKETALQNALAGLGYPVPRVVVHGNTEISGRPFTIMDRVPGETMLSGITFDESGISNASERLATVHAALHRIPSKPVVKLVEKAGIPASAFSLSNWFRMVEGYFKDGWFDDLRPGFNWLNSNKPSERETLSVCHGDFHPGNIMIHQDEVSGVLDWPGAAFAEPEFDVAITLVLMKIAGAELFSGAGSVMRRFGDSYLSNYQQLNGLDLEKVRYYEAFRCFRAFTRGMASHTPGTHPDLVPHDAYAWASPQRMKGIASRFTEITGIDLPLPKSLE